MMMMMVSVVMKKGQQWIMFSAPCALSLLSSLLRPPSGRYDPRPYTQQTYIRVLLEAGQWTVPDQVSLCALSVNCFNLNCIVLHQCSLELHFQCISEGTFYIFLFTNALSHHLCDRANSISLI